MGDLIWHGAVTAGAKAHGGWATSRSPLQALLPMPLSVMRLLLPLRMSPPLSRAWSAQRLSGVRDLSPTTTSRSRAQSARQQPERPSRQYRFRPQSRACPRRQLSPRRLAGVRGHLVNIRGAGKILMLLRCCWSLRSSLRVKSARRPLAPSPLYPLTTSRFSEKLAQRLLGLWSLRAMQTQQFQEKREPQVSAPLLQRVTQTSSPLVLGWLPQRVKSLFGAKLTQIKRLIGSVYLHPSPLAGQA